MINSGNIDNLGEIGTYDFVVNYSGFFIPIRLVIVKDGEKIYLEEDLRKEKFIDIRLSIDFDLDGDVLRNLIKGFESRWPNIDVKADYPYTPHAHTVIISGENEIAKSYLSNEIIDLKPYMDSSLETFDINDFIDTIKESITSDNENGTYSIPISMNTAVLVYNKKLFSAMHYDVPTTWEEVEILSKKMIEDISRGTVNRIMNFSGFSNPQDRLLDGSFRPLLLNALSSITTVAMEQWGLNDFFDVENAKDIFYYFNSLADANLIGICDNLNINYYIDPIKNFNCGMGIYTLQEVDMICDIANIGLAPIPTFSSNDKSVDYYSYNATISKEATPLERAAGWELIKYLLSYENGGHYIFACSDGNAALLPVTKSAYEDAN